MRIIARNGGVLVNGLSVGGVLGWDMEIQAEIRSHRGASATSTTRYILEGQRSGSFSAEADPADTVQQSIVSGPQSVQLTLTETSGVSHTFTAIIMPAWQVDRRDRVVRSWRFMT